MTTITISITLPNDVAQQAQAEGLLSPSSIESYVKERLSEKGPKAPFADAPPSSDFDPRLEGAVDPAMLRKGKIHGDIIGPFHEEWEEVR